MNSNRHVSSITNGFLNYLRAQKKTDLLPQIVAELAKKSRTAGQVIVQSSVPLTTDQKNQVTNLVKKQFPQAKNINFTLNPEIVGGLKILAGDRVIDLSLKAKLDNFVSSLA